jgi:uncharacterized protein
MVDELATTYPQLTFVMAHFGYPWLTDAAEVLYKNDNVWADLSGFLMGSDVDADSPLSHAWRHRLSERVAEAMLYTDKPNRFVFGSDWPLADIGRYSMFIESMLPSNEWASLFDANARLLFGLQST